MTVNIRHTTRQLSLPLTALLAALLASGVLSGWSSYLHRSPFREKYIPGASAWWQHLAVAVFACVLFGYARWRHQRRFGRHCDRLWLLAPLGRPAARRLAQTMHEALRRPAGRRRALAALLAAAAFCYCCYRDGLQVTAGLDPNTTVNAWGGPTYLGAMACHYLDGFLLMAAAAWLLDRILLPDPRFAAVLPPDAAGDGSLAGRPYRA